MLEPVEATELLASLQARATKLLEEIQEFEVFLQKQKRQDPAIQVRHLKKNVHTEIKTLARVCIVLADTTRKPDDYDEEREARNLKLLRSTNLTFYEAVWDAAKRSRGVVALGKMMPSGQRSGAKDCFVSSKKSDLESARKKTILVDLITKDGLEWVKVSTIKKDRVLFDIAKAGWEGCHQCAVSERSIPGGTIEESDLRLLKIAKDLHTASLQTRISYRHPKVRLVLPGITEGDSEEIDAMLRDIRAIGVNVECATNSEPIVSESHALITSPMGSFESMLLSPPEPMTRILNIDSTILISLISDISHVYPSALPDPQVISAEKRPFHRAILQQILEEEESPLLPTELYPVLAGRNLVCTVPTAARVCQIVETMASSTERIRASMIFGRGNYAGIKEAELRQELGRYSVHPVPNDLSLAITQIDFEAEAAFSKSHVEHFAFPVSIAKRAADNMSWSLTNQSVLLYGWRENIVTITSNQIIAGHFVQAINKVLDDQERENAAVEEFRGPEIRILQTARSLIGKHKSGKKSLDS